jgi:ATP-binding cassette subfamily B protein
MIGIPKKTAVFARSSSPCRLLTRVDSADGEEPRERPLDFRLIRRLFEFTRSHRRLRGWLLLLVALRAVQLPALTWVVAAIIDGPVQRRDLKGVALGACGFALLMVFTQIVLHFRQRYALELGEAVVCDLRGRLFEHLQSMTMAWHHRNKVGRIISRVTSDVEDVRIGVQEVLYVSLVQLGQMIVAAICMLWYEPRLFLIVLGLAPVLWLVNHFFHRRLSATMRAMRRSYSRVVATLAESIMGIRVTQGFVRQDENARLFRELVESHSCYNTAVLRTHGLFLPLLDLNNQAFISALLLVGGYLVIDPSGHTSIGAMVSFFFMANMFFSPISVLGNQYHQALTAMAGAERVFALLDTPAEWSDPPGARKFCLRGRVEFLSVRFAYSPQRDVLRDISFAAEPGQTVALVGHTGSGKSTITSLIAKFYLPTSGRLLIDGCDIRQISSESLHRQMGLVPQQNFLFQGTVAENLRIGRPDATEAEIRETFERLDCVDLLEALPHGLDTMVGERGVSLSAGQRQLVCFARALLADPRILVLDEATSSIDSETERRVQSALSTLLAGRTSFVVAHRLSTIQNADLVLVLDRGRIVERGRHSDLVRGTGAYSSLYRRFADAA